MSDHRLILAAKPSGAWEMSIVSGTGLVEAAMARHRPDSEGVRLWLHLRGYEPAGDMVQTGKVELSCPVRRL